MSDAVHDQIKSTIDDNQIVIFMKGNPGQPQCGFSATSSTILRDLNRPFAYVDVLEVPEARSGVKVFTNWPTIPQIFVNGEFIGGNDILVEMNKNGDLKTLLDSLPKPE